MEIEIRLSKKEELQQLEHMDEAAFYVNKCGYSIVRVDDWDKEKECGMFVFEKKCRGERND